MAQLNLNVGVSANDDTGTNRRVAFQYIQANFDELYTRGVIQSKSFISPSTSSAVNTDSAVYVDTDLIVSITTRSATSKLRVNFNAAFKTTSAAQNGVKGQIQNNIDSAGYVNILYGNQTVNFIDVARITANIERPISSCAQIDSPGLASVVVFKVTFAPNVNAENVTYADDKGINMITVDEILET